MQWERRMDLWRSLQKVDKPIVLYGMGDGADKILAVCQEYQIPIKGVFSSREFVRNKTFHGFRVMTYEHIKAIYPDMVILVAFGTSVEPALQEIFRIGHEQEILVPDVPVVGEDLFNDEYFAEHQDELEAVFRRLADDQSKQVFEGILQYKLTGNPMHLFACESELEQDQREILRLGDQETYLDLGAYNGDTVRGFLHLTGGRYRQIVAVEPDERNFAKLQNSTRDLENVRCINAAIGRGAGETHFAQKGGRNSRKSQGGKVTALTSIDEIGGQPSYIKMDVEGQEGAAVFGGRYTINAHRPRLQVAAYHRNEDLFALPLELWKLHEYKVYLRHARAINSWDTNFFFIP